MGGGGGQGGYEQRIEVIVKIAKKKLRGPVQGWGGGQSGRKLQVIVKMQKKEEKRDGVHFGDGG